MLAYVFRHWPQLTVSARDYEETLAEFHQFLERRPPFLSRASRNRSAPGRALPEVLEGGEANSPGLVDSTVFRVRTAPWLPAGRTGYEDWYLLDGSAAIDALNDAAVSGERKAPHDRVAAMAQTGIGSLYRLTRGIADLASAREAVWFPKPRGMEYDELYALLEPHVTGASLWRRQMVLGPPPEFGLLGAVGRLPSPLAPVVVPLERGWL